MDRAHVERESELFIDWARDQGLERLDQCVRVAVITGADPVDEREGGSFGKFIVRRHEAIIQDCPHTRKEHVCRDSRSISPRLASPLGPDGAAHRWRRNRQARLRCKKRHRCRIAASLGPFILLSRSFLAPILYQRLSPRRKGQGPGSFVQAYLRWFFNVSSLPLSRAVAFGPS